MGKKKLLCFVLIFLLILLSLLVLILIFEKTEKIARPKQYYNQLKNPRLAYIWDFNKSLKGVGGSTFNSSYFQIRKHNLFIELCCLEVDYSITYKHEEGHIFVNQFLNIEDFDDFEYQQFYSLNLTNYTSWRQYIISVSEGIADYYAINYFNNSISEEYLRFIEKNKKDRTRGYKQHYQGLKYINHSLHSGVYSDFIELTLNLGTLEQYNSYSDYLNQLW